jgi:4,5-dihydroxyphthalate decarboxylase
MSMARLALTLACWDYDRVRALQDGRVRPEGVDLNFISLQPEETFYRQARHREFDVSEMSFSSYLLTLNEPDPPFVAIPVFPSRSFRHQSIYINATSGIEKPGDLVGKRVGTPEFQLTAGVWERGILADEYGLPIDGVSYFTGALEGRGRIEKMPLDLPSNISITDIGPEKNLSDMLAAGEIDALYTAPEPSSFGRSENVRRLFPNFKEVEKEYAERTGIFPIMHTVVIKRALHEREPWLARSLTKAFHGSLRMAYDDLRHRSALKTMLPWLADHLTETENALGDGYWEYGLGKNNRHTVETLIRYSFEQGLAKRRFDVEEIFISSASDGFIL